MEFSIGGRAPLLSLLLQATVHLPVSPQLLLKLLNCQWKLLQRKKDQKVRSTKDTELRRRREARVVILPLQLPQLRLEIERGSFSPSSQIRCLWMSPRLAPQTGSPCRMQGWVSIGEERLVLLPSVMVPLGYPPEESKESRSEGYMKTLLDHEESLADHTIHCFTTSVTIGQHKHCLPTAVDSIM
ncbi:hypothetical protein EYF80_007499 [Liparis tanakae]|uniref:Uncharacterized protein n=1 Tax=Liparis tanakae TaxID=230148 RepID=A0A4Z2IY14_9TELE|nr:hypothetical protein EYF80_007499 [Liparis tanakae]